MSDPIPEYELCEMLARANAATAGPWTVEDCTNDCDVPYHHICSDVLNGGTGEGVANTYHEDAFEMASAVAIALEKHWQHKVKRTVPPICGKKQNAVFIAAARTDLPRVVERLLAVEAKNAELTQLPEWLINKLKTLGDYYQQPTDGRSRVHEIYGWMHVLCFHYVQNRREVKEYDAARRRAKELEAENARLRLRVLSAAGDDLCRLTQEEIKELSAGKVQIPPKEEFLASCERFHAQVANESGELSACLTLAQMIAENERLRSALRPFAEYAQTQLLPGMVDGARMHDVTTVSDSPTLGDCRKAAEVLARVESGDGGAVG